MNIINEALGLGEANIVWFMPFSIETVLLMVLVFGVSVLFHEGFHYLRSESFGLEPKMYWNGKSLVVKNTKPASPVQHRKILEAGLLMGAVPCVASFFIVGLWCLFPMTFYLWGSISDIKEISKIGGVK